MESDLTGKIEKAMTIEWKTFDGEQRLAHAWRKKRRADAISLYLWEGRLWRGIEPSAEQNRRRLILRA